MSDFENVHDFRYLADALNIEVSEEEVDRAVSALKEKDLFLDRDNFDSTDEKIEVLEEKSVGELGVRCYDFRSDVERDLIVNKLRKMLRKLSFHVLEDMEYDQFKVDLIRDFVEQHVEKSFSHSGLFFKKLAEIEDDSVFLRFLAKTIDDLWY